MLRQRIPRTDGLRGQRPTIDDRHAVVHAIAMTPPVFWQATTCWGNGRALSAMSTLDTTSRSTAEGFRGTTRESAVPCALPSSMLFLSKPRFHVRSSRGRLARIGVRAMMVLRDPGHAEFRTSEGTRTRHRRSARLRCCAHQLGALAVRRFASPPDARLHSADDPRRPCDHLDGRGAFPAPDPGA